MIRVRTNTAVSPPVSPDAAPIPTSAAGSPASKSGSQVPVLDQVQLSRLAASAPEDRSKKIAALKAEIASPDYLPPSLPVIRKLVSGAVSRAD
jgi:Anti-sigma-28 factor, FlgM